MELGIILTVVGLISSNLISIIALLIAHKNNKIAAKPTVFDDTSNRYLKEMDKTSQALTGLSYQVRYLNEKLGMITHDLSHEHRNDKEGCSGK